MSSDWLLYGAGPKFRQELSDSVVVSDELTTELRGPDGRIKDIEKVSSPQTALSFEPDQAIAMATRVLLSGTSYADALYLNILHFDRAIRAETRITTLEKELKDTKKQFQEQGDKIDQLEKRFAALEAKKEKAPESES